MHQYMFFLCTLQNWIICMCKVNIPMTFTTCHFVCTQDGTHKFVVMQPVLEWLCYLAAVLGYVYWMICMQW